MTYRIFTNDVGPNRYSCLKRVRAASWDDANRKAADIAQRLGCKAVAFPENRSDMWPDGRTGQLPSNAERFVQVGA